MSGWGACTSDPNRSRSARRRWRRCRTGGVGSTTCGTEPTEITPLRSEAGGKADQTDSSDGKESRWVADGEQSSPDECAGDLGRILHGLEHTLRAGLMTWLGHAAHLGV